MIDRFLRPVEMTWCIGILKSRPNRENNKQNCNQPLWKDLISNHSKKFAWLTPSGRERRRKFFIISLYQQKEEDGFDEVFSSMKTKKHFHLLVFFL